MLIKVLPAGPDAALEKLRSMRASPENHAQELAGFLSAPDIIYGVIAEAESTLAAHLRRVETWIPKGAVKELYRATGQTGHRMGGVRKCRRIESS